MKSGERRVFLFSTEHHWLEKFPLHPKDCLCGSSDMVAASAWAGAAPLVLLLLVTFFSSSPAPLVGAFLVTRQLQRRGLRQLRGGGLDSSISPEAAASSQKTGKNEEEANVVCHFEAFSDEVNGEARSANRSSVVFQQGSSLVIETSENLDGEFGVSRYLLFARGGGECVEEALVRCTKIDVDHSSVFLEDEVAAPATEVADFGGPTTAAASPSSSVSSSLCATRRCRPQALMTLSYARSMVAGFVAAVPNARRGLMIGVGGGMIPLWIQEKQPEVQLDAVDVAPDVLAAAPCFGLPDAYEDDRKEDGLLAVAAPSPANKAVNNSSNVRLVLADGRAFLDRQATLGIIYDVIFLDVYTPSNTLPPCLSTVEFFGTMRDRLGRGGVLVWNTHPANDEELGELLQVVSAVFPHVAVGQAVGQGNQIILASKDQALPPPKPFRGGGGDDDEDNNDLAAAGVGMWYAAADFQAFRPGDLDKYFSAKGSRPKKPPRRDADWCPRAE